MKTILTRKSFHFLDYEHARRMLSYQSKRAHVYVIPPHASIVPCGREVEDYVILTKLFCSNILRVVVHETASLEKAYRLAWGVQ